MTSKTTTRCAFISVILAGLVSAAAADEVPEKIRVLIIDGQSNHDWRSTTREFQAIFKQAGRFSVVVASVPERPAPRSGQQALAE